MNDERKILEILEPLVYDDLKVSALMGGKNLVECQAILHNWRKWLSNHYADKENVDNRYGIPGQYSVYFNIASKNVILYYALLGYKHFANVQHEEPDKILKMAVKAHAIIIGPGYKKPTVKPVDPMRVSIEKMTAFALADDLFANPQKYSKGWKPTDADHSSPIFLWQVLAAYETNLYAYKYYVEALKIANGEKENDRNDSEYRNSQTKRENKRYYSKHMEDIIYTYTKRR